MNKHIYILLIIIITSCNPGHYKSVRIDKVSPLAPRDCIKFLTASIGIWGGFDFKSPEAWYLPEYPGLKQFDAMCWRTTDGGKNWRGQKITDGTLNEFDFKDNIVYAIIETNKGSQIYTSNDLGENWKLKCTTKEGLHNLHVIDSNWFIGNRWVNLSETKDGGQTWHDLPTSFPVGRTFYHENYIYNFSFSQLQPPVKDVLVRKNLYTGEEKIIHLPDGCHGINGAKDIIFCQKDKETRVYRVNKNFSLTYLSSIKQGKAPDILYTGIYNNHIYIFLSTLSESIFKSSRNFYYSSDGGANWTRLGQKGYYSVDGNNMTDYTDSTGFKIFFNRESLKLGTFNVPAPKNNTP